MVSSRALLVTRAQFSGEVCSLKMLQNFCGVCSLRTGTLCCAVFSLILSGAGIIANNIIDIEYHKYYSIEASLMFEELLTFIVSAFCIYGAFKETKFSLLPWLIVAAFSLTVLLLTSLYYVIFGCYKYRILDVLFLLFCGLLFYGWMVVASYYTELKDRECSEEGPSPARSYIEPRAVTNPAAFAATPPPSYSVAVSASEKPPSYEEAELSKTKAGQMNDEL